MKVYNLPRGAGKTWRLIVLSEFTGYPIVTFCEAAVRNLQDIANAIGAKIPEPIPISRINEKPFNPKKVFVDEAMLCLNELLLMNGCDVQAATMTEPYQEINHI